MKTLKLYFLLMVLALSLTITFSFKKEDHRINTLLGKEITQAEIDRFLKNQMDSMNIKGISIAIINDAKVVYHRSMGIASIYSLDTVNDQTIFEAASLSKPVFAYFVMKEVEKGILNIDTPLYKYLPYPDVENDDRYKLITARMVLCHTSGFPNWRSDNPVNQQDGKLTINFIPGTKFSYSGEGYMYLRNVIAFLTKRNLYNLDSLFQQEVSKPLNLNHAHFGMNVYVAKHLASAHEGNKIVYDNGWERTSFESAGGLYTESISYANFLIAIMKEKGLKKESFNEMFKEQVKLPDESAEKKNGGNNGWGLGFKIIPTTFGTCLAHGGNNWGYTSSFMINKEKKFGYVFFTNANQCNELHKRLEYFLQMGNK
jgi:CubicO group peptidase (beta-lactamase class C family)